MISEATLSPLLTAAPSYEPVWRARRARGLPTRELSFELLFGLAQHLVEGALAGDLHELAWVMTGADDLLRSADPELEAELTVVLLESLAQLAAARGLDCAVIGRHAAGPSVRRAWRSARIAVGARAEVERELALEEWRCPGCGGDRVAPGKLVARSQPAEFFPDGLRFWSLKSGLLPLAAADGQSFGRAHGCVACGLVWARVDPDRLLQMMREAGTDETRARFGAGAADDEPPAPRAPR